MVSLCRQSVRCDCVFRSHNMLIGFVFEGDLYLAGKIHNPNKSS